MRRVEIKRTDGAQVCQAALADSLWTRGRGLLGRRRLPTGEGLLIKPCNSVHTFFMLFTLDVVFLDEDLRIIKCLRMPPFRFSLGGRRARQVLELAEGRIEALELHPGDQLTTNGTHQ